uniref:Uncharacterized protein n=1 Tax=Arundo donax TaxID=35708 RepID=A0A0A8ZHV7_ARUDO
MVTHTTRTRSSLTLLSSP